MPANDELPLEPVTTATAHDPPRSVDDPAVVRALQAYRAAVAAGNRPSRAELLARHPEIAAELAACLDALDFLQGAAGQLPAPAAPVQVEPLGDFRLVREIGRGGMGVVYEAVQLSLGRRVALKVLPFAAALDARQLQRFKNEAQAAALLRHQHIVAVHAVGSDRGVHFYAMDFVAGQTLADVIRTLRDRDRPTDAAGDTTVRHSTADPLTAVDVRQPDYFRTVARWGAQAAEALAHAHAVGVIHRDVKPANLLVDDAGSVWIADFGLAQVRENTRITRTGDFLGTLRYMSPEQTRSGHLVVDHRTDIYSLGVTLYELLTLEPAFGGSDTQEVMRQILADEPPPPRRRNPAVPVELETVVLKAMAKNRDERYATAAELADDLKRFLNDEPVRAARPTLLQRARKWARRHQTLVWAVSGSAVALLVLAVAGLAVSNAVIRRERANADRQREQAERARQDSAAALVTARKAVYQMLHRLGAERLIVIPQMEEVRRDVMLDALQLYQELHLLQGEDPALRLETALVYGRLGFTFGKLGQHAEADQALARAIALTEALHAESPQNPELRVHLISFLINRSRTAYKLRQIDQAVTYREKALALAERLVADFPDGGYQTRLGDVCIDLANLRRATHPAQAGALYRRAIALNALPEGNHHAWGRAHLGLGELYREQGRWDESEAALREALRQFVELLDRIPQLWQARERVGDAYLHLGRVLMATGRAAEAEQACRAAVGHMEQLHRDFPAVPDYRNSLAACYAALLLVLDPATQRPEADAVARKLLALPVEDARACTLAAWALANAPTPSARDVGRAVDLAERAVRLEPERRDHWTALGASHYRDGRPRAAIAALDRPTPSYPNEAGFAWYLLALCHGQLGDHEQARRWYGEAVRWQQEHRPRDLELNRLRREAEAVVSPPTAH